MDTTKKNINIVTPYPGNKDIIVLGIILFLFFTSFATMFGVSIYELVKKEPEVDLLFLGDEATQLQITSAWTSLYNFYTENVNFIGTENTQTYRYYKGEFRIILNSSTGVNFRVIDENGNVLGSTVSRGEAYLTSTIPFNSNGKGVSNLILQYTCTQNAIVSRLEIVLS